MGNLAALPDVEITILIDTREQCPWSFSLPTVKGTLGTGDYSLAGCGDWISIERKSLNDLIGCLSGGRDRFTKELERGRRIQNFSVIVEAHYTDILKGNFRSEMNPRAAWGSIIALQERYGVPFYFAGDSVIAGQLCETILTRWWKEHLKVFQAVYASAG
jgi:ERCC4-type nuclease